MLEVIPAIPRPILGAHGGPNIFFPDKIDFEEIIVMDARAIAKRKRPVFNDLAYRPPYTAPLSVYARQSDPEASYPYLMTLTRPCRRASALSPIRSRTLFRTPTGL